MSNDELRWRAPTKDDLDAWAGLIADMDAVDGLDELYSVEELAEELETPGLDPAVDARFGFTEEGALVAFGVVMTRPKGEGTGLHRVYLWGGVHPDHRRRGIGRGLLDWMAGHGTAKHHADHPGVDGVLEARVGEHEAGKEAMVTEAGFTPLRHWYELKLDLRVADLAAPVVPDGLRIERYRGDLDEAVRLAHNEAFADHWGSTPASVERWKHGYTGSHNFRPDLSFVVLDGDTVAAYLLTSAYPQDDAARGGPHGWVSYLGSRRAHRGRGLATSLLRAACLAYRDAGYVEALIGVDSANPTGALGLYERFGFTLDRRFTSFARPID